MNADLPLERPLPNLPHANVDYVGCPDKACSKHFFVFDVVRGSDVGRCEECGKKREKRQMYKCERTRCDFNDHRPQPRPGRCRCGSQRIPVSM